ncbi:MAG TPA: 50S ribosomal protein L20 [bacterium]|nr:50S ribosomal protein L20 [bacterium]
MRVKRGTVRRAKHKKILKLAKGFQGRRKSVFKLAKQAILKAGQYAYRDRRNKKRDFRALWIIRINGALSQYGLSYSKFMGSLKKQNIEIDRKILSDMAMKEPKAFKAIVDKVK